MPWWGLTRWEYDGQTVYGEDMDYIYAKHNRKLWEAVRRSDLHLATVGD